MHQVITAYLGAAGAALAPQAAMIEDASNYAFTGNATYPAAFYDSTNNETWQSWESWTGVNRCVKCAVYDHDTETWGEEIILSHNSPSNDNHGTPALCMDSDGHVHAFFGAHNTTMRHAVTVNPRDNSAWAFINAIGSDTTYPNPVLVGSTIYLFTRENTQQNLIRRKITGTGLSASVGAGQTVASFTGGRFYIGTTKAIGTDIHIFATYADSSDTFRRDIYHFVYDTTDDSVENSTGGVSTAVGSQPISKATADSSYLIFDQTTNSTSAPTFVNTPDGKLHVAFHDGASSPYDIRHMVFSGGAWSSSTVATTTTGVAAGAGGFTTGEIALVANSDNSVELWYADDDSSAYTFGGLAKRIIRSSGGTWGSEETIATPEGSVGITRFSAVLNGHADYKVIFSEDNGSEADSAAGGIRAYAYGDGGFVGRTVDLGSAPAAATETVDPYWYNNALVVTFDGANGSTTFTDDSRHAHTLTANGSAQIQSNKLELNGTTSYVTAPFSPLWVPGSKFSIEAMGVEFDTTGGTQTIIAMYRATGSQQVWALLYQAGTLYLFGQNNDYTGSPWYLAAAEFTPATDGTDYDIGVHWDGRSVAISVDGVVLQRSAMANKFVYTTGQVLAIGANFASGGSARQFLDGRIAAVRITRGVDRSAQANYERHALPLPLTAPSLTDANWPDVILLAGYDDEMYRIRDFGPLDMPLIIGAQAAGSTAVTLGDGTASIAFDGSGDYVSINDDALMELGGSDVTIETFARHNNVSTAIESYVTKWATSGNNRSWFLEFRGDQSPDKIWFARSSNGSSAASTVVSGDISFSNDTWYHVAYCRNGSNNRIFVDGTQSGSTNTTAVTLFNGGSDTTIGGESASGAWMNGYLTQVRITKAARYTSNFTAPTGALPTF